MELVPASSGGGDSDAGSIQVDPVARRVANIRTVAVKAVPLTRKIKELEMDAEPDSNGEEASDALH